MSEQEKKQIQELLGMIFTVFNLIEQRIDHINIYYNKEESSSYCKRQCPKYCVNEKTGFRYNSLYLDSVFKYKNKLVHNGTIHNFV